MELNIKNIPKSGVCVALGTFDGIHSGHAAVLKETAALAERLNCESAALLFNSHPRADLAGGAPPAVITEQEKRRLIQSFGIKHIFSVDFSLIRELLPEEFVTDVLRDALGAKGAVCGYNYRFGKNARADSAALLELCRKHGIKAVCAGKVELRGLPVSSTAVRGCIGRGDMRTAAQLLGRLFSYDFTVSHGQKLGRLLGSPTINQHFPEGFVLPKSGVYASAVRVGEKIYPGVTNVGVRPTVGGTAPRSETYIMGFEGDLYGRNVPVGLIEFIRPEMRFDSLEELKQHIGDDSRTAKKIFEELSAEYEREDKGSLI